MTFVYTATDYEVKKKSRRMEDLEMEEEYMEDMHMGRKLLRKKGKMTMIFIVIRMEGMHMEINEGRIEGTVRIRKVQAVKSFLT